MNANAVRFATKAEAEAANWEYSGFSAVFVGTNYIAIDGLPKAGWYLSRREGRHISYAHTIMNKPAAMPLTAMNKAAQSERFQAECEIWN